MDRSTAGEHVAGEERQHQDGLSDRGCASRYSRIPLHRGRAGSQTTKQDAAPDERERFQPCQQRDSNCRVSVPGRQILIERIRHTQHLHATGEPGQGTTEQESAQLHRSNRNAAGAGGRGGTRPHRAKAEPGRCVSHRQRREDGEHEREEKPRMQPRRIQRGKASRAGDRRRLWVHARGFL